MKNSASNHSTRESRGFVLENVELGKRLAETVCTGRIIRVKVDGDAGLSLDGCCQ